MQRTLFIVTVLLLGLYVLDKDCRAQMQSASYRIPTSVFSGGGGPIASASYQINSTTGQPSPLGHTSNTNYIIVSGFWHFVLEAVVDSDGDGIDDNWELHHFGNLTTANEMSDFDRDGYSDLQEYLNNLAFEIDPQGNVYDPKVKNAHGGTGYDPTSASMNIIYLVLPAILGGSR